MEPPGVVTPPPPAQTPTPSTQKLAGDFCQLLPRGEHLIVTQRDFDLPRELQSFYGLDAKLREARMTGVRTRDEALAEFKHISKNEYTTDAQAWLKRRRRGVDKDPVCMCRASRDTHTGCGQDCVNRAVQIECSPKDCPVEEIFPGGCNNQRIQRAKRPQLKVEEATGGRGFGLFAQVDIGKGSLITEYVGEVCTSRECELRLESTYVLEKHKYLMCVAGGLFIDATRRGNLARFLNHSCEPNSDFQEWWVRGEPRMGLFALRDVARGEEVVFNYNFQRLGEDESACKCQSKTCRGVLGVVKESPASPPVPLVVEPGLDPVLNDKVGVAPDRAAMQRMYKVTASRPIISKSDALLARDLCCFLPRSVALGAQEYAATDAADDAE